MSNAGIIAGLAARDRKVDQARRLGDRLGVMLWSGRARRHNPRCRVSVSPRDAPSDDPSRTPRSPLTTAGTRRGQPSPVAGDPGRHDQLGCPYEANCARAISPPTSRRSGRPRSNSRRARCTVRSECWDETEGRRGLQTQGATSVDTSSPPFAASAWASSSVPAALPTTYVTGTPPMTAE